MRMLSVKPDHRKEAASEMATTESTRAYDCRHYDTCLMGAALVDMKTMPCSGCSRYCREEQMSLKDMISYVCIAAKILEVDETALFAQAV